MFTMRRAVVAAAGIAVTGGVIFGATEAFAASPAASVNAASVSAAATTSTTSSSTTDVKAACAHAAHPARCEARREAARDRGGALLKRGAHGQATVKDKAGAYVVHEWQVGKVGSVSGSAITVTDGSGATWTWTVDSSTTYRVDGTKGTLSGVHAGDTILIRGQRGGSANDAKAVLDPNQSKLQSKLG
jgi:uncharacterized cupredoxin-like copper-binding protein